MSETNQNARANATTTLSFQKSPVVPELNFLLKVDNPDNYKKVLDELLPKIQDLKPTIGSVMRGYSYSLQLYDPKNPLFANVNLKLNQHGFREYGLYPELKNGVFCIEGVEGADKKPTCAYDGNVELILNADVRCRVKMESIVRISLPAGNPMADCRVEIRNCKLNPITLTILPNPRTLWKDVPTDPNAPFQKGDVDYSSATLNVEPKISVIAASRRGRSHANEGKFRDDHFFMADGVGSNGWAIFAVADGAGSAKYSREGSKIACETFVSELSRYFSEYNVSLEATVVKEIEAKEDWKTNPLCDRGALERTNFYQFFCFTVREAWVRIKKSADANGAKVGDYNTTLLCAAMKRFPATEKRPAMWAIASYWVGDGVAAIYRPNGQAGVLPLGAPDGGEFAGQTRFITMADEVKAEKVLPRLRLAFVEDFQALALATDGITDPFFPAENNVGDYAFWQKFWNETLEEEFPGVLDPTRTVEDRARAALIGLNFFVDGNHDDRTLLLAMNDQCALNDEPFVYVKPAAPETPTETPKDAAEQTDPNEQTPDDYESSNLFDDPNVPDSNAAEPNAAGKKNAEQNTEQSAEQSAPDVQSADESEDSELFDEQNADGQNANDQSANAEQNAVGQNELAQEPTAENANEGANGAAEQASVEQSGSELAAPPAEIELEGDPAPKSANAPSNEQPFDSGSDLLERSNGENP